MKYMITALFVLAGCTPIGPTTQDLGEPKDWKVFTTPSANYHYVFPVVMDDGTRCVAMVGNSSGGRAISCAWHK